MEDPAEDPLWREAESLYVDWLLEEDGQRRVPFDRLCVTHPKLALILRKIKAQDDAMRALAADSGMGGGGFADSSVAREETANMDAAAGAFSPSAARTSELVERVRGRRLAVGKYFVHREIGKGSMGRVLKAWDDDLRRFVALKLMKDRRGSAPPGEREQRALIRFVEEAQVTAQLDHPNIVPVHEFGVTADGQTYFSMKLVKGREFGHVIRAVHEGTGEWTMPRALGVLVKACDALSYAHDKGVVHRDLKPANIMVGRFGAVYVMDWGLARVITGTEPHHLLPSGEVTEFVRTSSPPADEGAASDPLRTQEGSSIGTPLYMPPEQASGSLRGVGPQSDVYGIGAILYHLLAGVPPYHVEGKRQSALEVLQALRAGPPRPLGELAPNVPKELRAIVQKAMERSLEDRYANMGELSADVAAFIEGRVVGAWRPNAAQGVKKWALRNKALAAALGACALLLGWSALGSQASAAWSRERSRAATTVERALAGPLDEGARDAARSVLRALADEGASAGTLRAAEAALDAALRGRAD